MNTFVMFVLTRGGKQRETGSGVGSRSPSRPCAGDWQQLCISKAKWTQQLAGRGALLKGVCFRLS